MTFAKMQRESVYVKYNYVLEYILPKVGENTNSHSSYFSWRFLLETCQICNSPIGRIRLSFYFFYLHAMNTFIFSYAVCFCLSLCQFRVCFIFDANLWENLHIVQDIFLTLFVNNWHKCSIEYSWLLCCFQNLIT